jgi:uncharacterized protein with FMN-binding domain
MNDGNAQSTKRKGKRKMIGWIIGVAIFLAVLFGVGALFCAPWSPLKKEHAEAASLPLDGVDFTTLADGVYVGEYEGGMYHWRTNKVQVTVSGGKVTDIQVLEHKENQKPEFLGQLYGRVIDKQSLEVDVVSGATLTSKAYLKGVEQALIQAQK